MSSKDQHTPSEIIEEGDTITIHLGVELPEEQYNEVVASVVDFLNRRWPQFTGNRFKN